jgi:diketogulonate reductase-like aldo/keto reductase
VRRASTSAYCSRESVSVQTSKLPPELQGRGTAGQAVKQALVDLRLDYLDLMLIHFPATDDEDPTSMSNAPARDDSRQDLQEMYGKATAAGAIWKRPRGRQVTYDRRVQLRNPPSESTVLVTARVQPVVNQCEMHPFYPNRQVFDCRAHNIHMQTYSSLGGHRGVGQLITNSTVRVFLTDHKHATYTTCCRLCRLPTYTPAHVLYAYALCQGCSVLPRTTSNTRDRECAFGSCAS